jgi:hypothetical protein
MLTPPQVAPSPRSVHPWRLLPTPTGTPFTFAQAAVLTGTPLFATYAGPDSSVPCTRPASGAMSVPPATLQA